MLQDVKQTNRAGIEFCLYSEKLKAYFTGFFWGMPSFSPLQSKAKVFSSFDEAKTLAWQRATSGNMIVIEKKTEA